MSHAGVARIGDTVQGTCVHNGIIYEVTGTIVSGSQDVLANNKGIAREGDFVEHNCPICGTGAIQSGSNRYEANGKRIARIGDEVVFEGGIGTIITGSTDVLIPARRPMTVEELAILTVAEASDKTIKEILDL